MVALLAPSPQDVECLALLLDLPPGEVGAAWAAVAAGSAYRVFHLERPDGKRRTFHVPHAPLRRVQRAVLTRVLNAGPVSPAAYGGVPGRSFLSAARLHLPAARYEVVLDLRDAFGAATYRLVRVALAERLRLELRCYPKERRDGLVDLLAHLLTVRRAHGTRCLPLGAPTSTAAFNLVCYRFDREVRVLLERLLCPTAVYTRYVDDLVFTCAYSLPVQLEKEVAFLVGKHHFHLADEKTRRTTGGEVDVHGLTWRWDGLALTDRLAAQCADRLRAARARLGASASPAAARAAVASLRALDAFLRQVYVPPRARPLELQFEVPRVPEVPPAGDVARLWPAPPRRSEARP